MTVRKLEARALVPNDEFRQRLVVLDLHHEHAQTGVTLDDLCFSLAKACDFTRHRRGGRVSRSDAVRGVKVLLGLAPDKWDTTRAYVRAYRAMQLDDALTRLERQAERFHHPARAAA